MKVLHQNCIIRRGACVAVIGPDSSASMNQFYHFMTYPQSELIKPVWPQAAQLGTFC